MKNVLLISICKEPLHEYEFVKPIEDILERGEISCKNIHYQNFREEDLSSADAIIIAGTSLKDYKFIEDIKMFKWIKNTKIPILGICGGMQIIGLIYDGKLKSGTEIGYFNESFTENFLGLTGDQEVYHLHNNHLDKNSLENFKFYTKGTITQAIKHNNKEIYGTLFHPEVRNKKLILEFVK
ncbi:MAG: hypothetical protein IH845_03295 [Nanoarchaeota archaeon]|nr:hypothetical protein [Nanoarchaeota archaeon]